MNQPSDSDNEPDFLNWDGVEYHCHRKFQIYLADKKLGELFYNEPPGSYTFKSAHKKIQCLEEKAWAHLWDAKLAINIHAVLVVCDLDELKMLKEARRIGNFREWYKWRDQNPLTIIEKDSP